MVAIPVQGQQDQVDLEKLMKGLKEQLPSYARPIFVRLVTECELTGNYGCLIYLKHVTLYISYLGSYKLKKGQLRDEGFDLAKVKNDPVFFHDFKLGKYVPLTKELFDNINQGKIRL